MIKYKYYSQRDIEDAYLSGYYEAQRMFAENEIEGGGPRKVIGKLAKAVSNAAKQSIKNRFEKTKSRIKGFLEKPQQMMEGTARSAAEISRDFAKKYKRYKETRPIPELQPKPAPQLESRLQ